MDSVQPHLLTLLSVAPELARDFPVPAEIAAAFDFSREGNARSWTLRIAHGVTDFLLVTAACPRSITFCNVEHADPLDQEFIAILLRRADPALLTVKVCPASDAVAPSLSPSLEDALAAPRAFLGFYGLTAPGDEIALLHAASDRCMHMAYYDAALEWASRGQALADPVADPQTYGKLARNALFALLLLGRHDETAAVCKAAQAKCADPALHAHATYAMAILNLRPHDPALRNLDAAKAWIEQSLAFTERLSDAEIRVVNHAFLMNTMALVELRKGDPAAALDLLNGAMALMTRQAPGKCRFECGILLHNRARLHARAGRIIEAIGELTAWLQAEPSSSEAYFDRGLLHQRAGSHDLALKDYDSAIRWSPPYWEPHFNRAQVLTALEQREAAIADYDRVAVLHPDHLETLINRGRLHFELDHLDLAERDAAQALRLDGKNARALCLRGLVAIGRRDFDAADQDLSDAIATDPQLADAWANRATIHFKMGRFDAALADIDRALALREDADIVHNRGRILQACAAKRDRSARP